MKLKHFAMSMLALLAFFACDDNTEDIGITITDNMDHMNISTDTFELSTRSIEADSVLSRTTIGYLGKVRDPETGAYIVGNFMTQFHTFEDYDLPEKSRMVSIDGNGNIIADSCELRLYYNDFYGDSLAVMKVSVYELSHPMEESANYYSNYNPIKEGYVSEASYKAEKVYTLADLNVSETYRASSTYTPNIRITLNAPYTDKEGKTYNNYGSYVLNKFYEDPANFHNSYNFAHHVAPGFYFENSGGLGSMANIFATQLNIYFRYVGAADTTVVGTVQFTGTEEVLQTTNITNDKSSIQRLIADNTCTYVKSPAGIFTEITIPVDDIMRGHDNDSLSTAHVEFARINDSKLSQYSFAPPTTMLIIPRDSIYSFFEHQQVANYKTSFTAGYSSTTNSYVYQNISNLVKEMYHRRNSSENWNKAVLIPVQIQTNSNNEMIKCLHDMSLSSTRLVGGSNNTNSSIKMSVIYGKFE